jgi:hypothetical protein
MAVTQAFPEGRPGGGATRLPSVIDVASSIKRLLDDYRQVLVECPQEPAEDLIRKSGGELKRPVVSHRCTKTI